MPINYSKYPPNWSTEIRPRILARANNCCERCGLQNHAVGYRNTKGVFLEMTESYSMIDKKTYYYDWRTNSRAALYKMLPNGNKVIKIVLTIAHLDHDSSNYEVTDDRLQALCQKCHLSLDHHRHVHKRKYGMEVFKNQPELF